MRLKPSFSLELLDDNLNMLFFLFAHKHFLSAIVFLKYNIMHETIFAYQFVLTKQQNISDKIMLDIPERIV